MKAVARANRVPTSLLRLARDGVDGLLDAVLPQTCLVTNVWLPARGMPVAPEIAAEIDRLKRIPYCRRCGRNAHGDTVNDGRCYGCRSEDFWNVREIVRIGPYATPLRRLLLDLKFAGHERNVAFLADLLAEELATRPWFSEVERLVPVPMHRLRSWQRPCDHANLLAEGLSRILGVKTAKALKQSAYRRSQIQTSSRNERFANVRGVFTLRSAKDVAGKCVCIVDNMATSGATLHEVSKTLRAAGAKRIYAAICARAALFRAPQPTELGMRSDQPDAPDEQQ